uniref:Zinc finger protein RFP-like n=1 Tax=Podarcis muralis TaxID=64176 RepID=A0A670HZE6_PODMU
MAASGGAVQDLCEEATCSICLECFRDPVIIPECGHNFCRACLIQCWEKSEGEASCPLCREIIQHRTLIPNRPLANVVEILGAEKVSLPGGKGAEGKGRVCEKHQEPLKLFCKEEEAPICVVCHVSKEHKGHEVIPLEEALQEYKKWPYKGIQISGLFILQEQTRCLILAHSSLLSTSLLQKQTGAEREKMVAEFRRLHQFLEEQEKLLLAQMAEVEKEIAAKREERLARLSRELSSLDSLIREMEEKLQEPESELLQVRPHPDARGWSVMLQTTVVTRDANGIQNVTLDPDTANPWLSLSEDRKSVRRGKVFRYLPNNPERFDTYGYVLGCEGFTTGRHFWEVIVGREEGWGVGVARKSVKRKGKFCFDTREGIWGLGKWGGGYELSSPHEFPHPSEEPKRIRVTLNFEGGRVSFYDADTAALLRAFPAIQLITDRSILPLGHKSLMVPVIRILRSYIKKLNVRNCIYKSHV